MSEFAGTVVKKPWGVGSKSESNRVILVTKDKEYVLRRKGGNPFQDPELDKLVGNWYVFEGELIGDYTLQIEI